MKAIILCGGRGTRMEDISELLPKPMLTIGNKPILWHIMKLYAHYGIKEFVLCLGHKGWVIKEFFLNYCAKVSDVTVTLNESNTVAYHNNHNQILDWKVTMVETGENAQTGARIWNARSYLEDEDIFSVTYGDGVGNIDIRALIQAHKASGLLGTIAGVRPSGRFGEIEFSGNLVSSFDEKPNVSLGLYNGGFMVFNREVLDKYFRPGNDLILEGETLPRMVKDKQLGIYQHQGFWQCVDTVREHQLLNQRWEQNMAPWRVWE